MTALKPQLDGLGAGLDASEMMADSGVIGLWRYDVDRGLLSGDDAMARSYKLDPEQVRQGLSRKRFREAIHPMDLPAAVQALNHSLQYGTDYRVRYRLQTETGHWKMVSANGRTHRNEEGDVTHIAGINLLAEDDGDTDPWNRMALLAAELMQLSQGVKDERVRALSYAILEHVSWSIAGELSKDQG